MKSSANQAASVAVVDSRIIVPPRAAKYILFQRTPYLFFRHNRGVQSAMKRIPRRIAYGLESVFSNFNLTVSAEARLRRGTIERLFSEDMAREYESIKAFLPATTSAILDVGSGAAGIDVLLYRHYAGSSPRSNPQASPAIYLLDKTEMPSKVYYSFRDKGCYYNSMAETKALLIANGIPGDKVFLQEAHDNIIDFPGPFDLIISLISWGFHYPVSTYLDQAYAKLKPGGVLILDVRKTGDGGLDAIRAKFGGYKVISESDKNTRVMARK